MAPGEPPRALVLQHSDLQLVIGKLARSCLSFQEAFLTKPKSPAGLLCQVGMGNGLRLLHLRLPRALSDLSNPQNARKQRWVAAPGSLERGAVSDELFLAGSGAERVATRPCAAGVDSRCCGGQPDCAQDQGGQDSLGEGFRFCICSPLRSPRRCSDVLYADRRGTDKGGRARQRLCLALAAAGRLSVPACRQARSLLLLCRTCPSAWPAWATCWPSSAASPAALRLGPTLPNPQRSARPAGCTPRQR